MSGSRVGITDEAISTLQEYINNNEIVEAHHGDCIGADAEFHDIVVSYDIPVHIHPPDYGTYRAYKKGDTIYNRKPYLERNRSIVNSTDILLGFPNGNKNVIRSGTWSTIRYAKKNNKPVMIVYPDGSFETLNID